MPIIVKNNPISTETAIKASKKADGIGILDSYSPLFEFQEAVNSGYILTNRSVKKQSCLFIDSSLRLFTSIFRMPLTLNNVFLFPYTALFLLKKVLSLAEVHFVWLHTAYKTVAAIVNNPVTQFIAKFIAAPFILFNSSMQIIRKGLNIYKQTDFIQKYDISFLEELDQIDQQSTEEQKEKVRNRIRNFASLHNLSLSVFNKKSNTDIKKQILISYFTSLQKEYLTVSSEELDALTLEEEMATKDYGNPTKMTEEDLGQAPGVALSLQEEIAEKKLIELQKIVGPWVVEQLTKDNAIKSFIERLKKPGASLEQGKQIAKDIKSFASKKRIIELVDTLTHVLYMVFALSLIGVSIGTGWGLIFFLAACFVWLVSLGLNRVLLVGKQDLIKVESEEN